MESIDDVFKEMEEVKAGIGCIQNPYHEFDVYIHTMKFVEEVKKLTDDIDVIAAGYLHDIGKPVVAEIREDKDGNPMFDDKGRQYHTFPDHERVGKDMVFEMDQDVFEKFGMNQNRIAHLVGYHYCPMIGIYEMRKAKDYVAFKESFYRLEEQLENMEVEKEDILTMFLADCISKGKVADDINELNEIRLALLEEGSDKENRVRGIYEIQKGCYKEGGRYARKE